MSSAYSHLFGLLVSTDDRVWCISHRPNPRRPGLGPYWADGNQSPGLTDEEIERFTKVACGPGWNDLRRLDPERDRLTPPPQVV